MRTTHRMALAMTEQRYTFFQMLKLECMQRFSDGNFTLVCQTVRHEHGSLRTTFSETHEPGNAINSSVAGIGIAMPLASGGHGFTNGNS